MREYMRRCMYSYDTDIQKRLGVLWGKSALRAGGTAHLLLAHLLDTAAVAEQIWAHYLAPSTRRALDEVAGGPGRGQPFFSWLCGIHDCGKATPVFQCLDETGQEAVRRVGLGWDSRLVNRHRHRWRHDRAGGNLIRRLLDDAGWAEEHIGWVWPLVAGHHGTFPSLGGLKEPRDTRGQLQGKGQEWREVQDALTAVFTNELGFTGLAEVQPKLVPSRAAQLYLSGLIVMADWIASDQRYFRGLDTLSKVSMEVARTRAAAAWATLGLRGGWGQLTVPGEEAFHERFGQAPRPSQALVLDAVRRMAGSGIIVVEAPTGEGKTKAALTAAEILAARFGADGVFVGMPTQATSDPMFSSVRTWVTAISADLASQVALLHGKRMFNREWRSLVEAGGEHPDDCYAGVEEDDPDDPYGYHPGNFHGDSAPERKAPAVWFLGKMRGLLCPFVVGTIDQLLFAATRTKHVMLRMAGLMGKVVVLDEVHAADIYMSAFLKEGLRWLGQAGVPTVLLSATLPAPQRRELVAAYLAGAASAETFDVPDLPRPGGYPSVTAAWTGRDGAGYYVATAPPWRADLCVRVEVLAERPPQATAEGRDDDGVSPGDAAIAELLKERLRDGGCALIIRNTVPRAQATYKMLRTRYGECEVRLLHGRLHARHRADRTEECLSLLGPPGEDGAQRPFRLIVVATQVAEQSFDVDADLLITDLAPIDLLVQRLGRVHRHDGVQRPDSLRTPCMVVTGFGARGPAVPWILPASEGIYGRYLLLRTAALITAAHGQKWSLPGQVPELVAQVYEEERPVVPTGWAEAEKDAYAKWSEEQRRRAEKAAPFLLTRFGEHGSPTLDGLHYGGSRGSMRDEQVQALVRDGPPTVEVVLVRRDERGFSTLNGRWLGVNGEASPDLLDAILEATVRLPSKLTDDAERELSPLDGWRDHPWLRHSRALVLDDRDSAQLGGYLLRYDDDLGLVVTGGPGPR
jgi:CRISPR-associated endonuclease/helicase Cas3